jgi:hypothetical protein
MRDPRKFLAMLVVGSGLLLVPTVPARADTATVNVSPSTGLTAGQEVTVTLTGWRVNATNPQEPPQLSLIQCDIGSVDISTCQVTATEEVVFFDLDGSGNATAQYTVEVISGSCDETTPAPCSPSRTRLPSAARLLLPAAAPPRSRRSSLPPDR